MAACVSFVYVGAGMYSEEKWRMGHDHGRAGAWWRRKL